VFVKDFLGLNVHRVGRLESIRTITTKKAWANMMTSPGITSAIFYFQKDIIFTLRAEAASTHLALEEATLNVNDQLAEQVDELQRSREAMRPRLEAGRAATRRRLELMDAVLPL
jgi:hypothetical protein